MRKIVFLTVAFAVPLILTASPDDLKANAPWTESREEGVRTFRVDYSGAGWAGMYWKFSVKPDTHYRISCDAKSSLAGREVFGMSIERSGVKQHASGNYRLSETWAPCVFYFFSGDSSSAILRPYAMGGLPVAIQLRNFKVEEVTQLQFTENLLQDGDFEQAGEYPAFWRKPWEAKENRSAIVANENFLAGDKNMQVRFVPASEDVSGLLSHALPVRPGKNYEWRFWAKAERPVAISCVIQIWPQFAAHAGKHDYIMKKINVSPEWREYAVRFSVPVDEAQVPDLRDRAANLRIDGKPEEPCLIRFDNMSFRELSGK